MNAFNDLTDDKINQAAHCLKVLGNPVRLKIVAILSSGQQMVKQISDTLDIPHNVACEHLRLLLHCGFVSSSRSGREVFYKIQDTHLLDLLGCIKNRFSK